MYNPTRRTTYTEVLPIGNNFPSQNIIWNESRDTWSYGGGFSPPPPMFIVATYYIYGF